MSRHLLVRRPAVRAAPLPVAPRSTQPPRRADGPGHGGRGSPRPRCGDAGAGEGPPRERWRPGRPGHRASGKLVLPGFVDVHTHLWQSSMRGGCADRDLFGWLAACNRPTFPRITPADMYRFVRLAALDSLRSGVTTLVDWVDAIGYDTTERYVRALTDTGVRFTYGLQRARSQDAGVYPGVEDVLRAATLGGADTIGMADRIGSLTPGKRADVIVIDPATLNFAPRFDRVNQIVFNGRPENVHAVFVDGRPLVLEGRLLDVDTRRVVREAEEAASRLRSAD
ncbi:amidohydrolase family protein [Streptomyces sp. NPDC060334]|uniref:amidohydrolase family protein n=1 Tax=unclassified Streptomyces TaxID=2593676 RepID=UPI003651550A